MMNKWLEDLKSLRGAWLFTAGVFYVLFLLSFLLSDEPRDLFFFNEMFMIPLVILITVVLFQKEFGGYFTEVFATLPLSMGKLIMRKLLQLFLAIVLLHGLWSFLYRLKFNELQTTVYSYFNEGIVQESSWIDLFLQSAPSYAAATSVTLTGLVLTKKVYGGLGAGFALWMFEVISQGRFLGQWTFFTVHIPEGISFTGNRMGLLSAFVILVAFSIFLASKREKWLISDDSY